MTKVATGCLRMTKVAIFVVLSVQGLCLVEYGNYGTLSLYVALTDLGHQS